tara:strand:+ start:1617 stop:2021 length:405 start_codon:yes stop_codon:yes gene_type:complete
MTEQCFIKKSPAYFGKKAGDFPIGHSDIGYDNETWCVTIKNNRYVWVKKTEDYNLINNEIAKKITYPENNNPKKKKYTIYNEFLEIKMKQLKETNLNLNLSPKELFALAVSEWHNIKINKEELNNFLYLYKKND